MKKLLVLLPILSGCSTVMFENRVSCTLDKQQGIYTSWYRSIGVSSKIADQDVQIMCKKDQK